MGNVVVPLVPIKPNIVRPSANPNSTAPNHKRCFPDAEMVSAGHYFQRIALGKAIILSAIKHHQFTHGQCNVGLFRQAGKQSSEHRIFPNFVHLRPTGFLQGVADLLFRCHQDEIHSVARVSIFIDHALGNGIELSLR